MVKSDKHNEGKWLLEPNYSGCCMDETDICTVSDTDNAHAGAAMFPDAAKSAPKFPTSETRDWPNGARPNRIQLTTTRRRIALRDAVDSHPDRLGLGY